MAGAPLAAPRRLTALEAAGAAVEPAQHSLMRQRQSLLVHFRQTSLTSLRMHSVRSYARFLSRQLGSAAVPGQANIGHM